MTKKSRFDFSLDELQALINGLKDTQDPGTAKIAEKFMQKGLNLALQHHANTEAPFEDNDAVVKIVKKFLSILSGKPESAITPTTTLSDLKLTTEHKNILRVNLNKWIKQQSGTSTISEGEIGAARTVKDVIDLVNSKL